jgi:hypothetical protein
MRATTAFLLFFGSLAAAIALAASVLTWGYPVVGALLTVFILACSVFVATSAYSVLFGAPFVPIDRDRVRTMLDLAQVRPGERLVDLGAGDGRIVVAAAQRGAVAEGWEISPFLWLLGQWNIRRAGVGDRARMRLGSYWDTGFRDADVVTLFLITQQMPRMEKKLQTELRPGSRVASYAFTFPAWEHEAKAEGVYLYRR